MITIALAKGRLADQTLDLLEQLGIDCRELRGDSRKLIFTTDDGSIRFIMVKPSDVPAYVEYGTADIGIAGKDTLLEEGRPLYEMLDLKLGCCRLAVAGFADRKNSGITNSHTRVATKYPNITRNYFAGKGETVEIIKLNGSVELGPLTGLSDVIVDIVESGRTLAENGLEVLEEIGPVSARLVVNQVSLKTKRDEIKRIIDGLRELLEGEANDS
ncbi:MAG TPA: ATP phosphoribosyltransferase [Clostridiales bacterium]|jgi:ATP phosphoribosyltransferase|nr:ATP phosphoribosyltransferase [Clostridiales bacterium]